MTRRPIAHDEQCRYGGPCWHTETPECECVGAHEDCDGTIRHACGEDTCCCADPYEYECECPLHRDTEPDYDPADEPDPRDPAAGALTPFLREAWRTK